MLPPISSNGEPVLQVRDLRTQFFDKKTVLKAVDGVSFDLHAGEVLGIVGESGCGKTTLALSMLNLIPHPGSIESGQILFKGRDVLRMSDAEMRDLRGRDVSMIFQDPVAGLNPVLSIGDQVQEIITAHNGADKREARRMAVELLNSMGLADAERVAARYPFQLSGGMAQRVMIATAMALQPSILIADEPTSALDMTVQAQILEELRKLRDQGVAILLITHDLGVIAQMADRVEVMYGGRLAESASADALFEKPRHPYTWALLASLPRLHLDVERLRQVKGRPPDMTKLPDECAFAPRCPKVRNECRTLPAPPLEPIESDHLVACFNPMYHAEDGDEEDEE
jgi:oligopeptide/dipeptide ABC transporter ATP-binding protein